MDDHHFPVEDALALQLERAGDGREPFGPVVAIAGEYPDLTGINVNLSPVAVVLDFVDVVPCGGLHLQCR
jgi:hypothetical protein